MMAFTGSEIIKSIVENKTRDIKDCLIFLKHAIRRILKHATEL